MQGEVKDMNCLHSLPCGNCGKTVSGTMSEDVVWFIRPDLSVVSKPVFWCIKEMSENRSACSQRCAQVLVNIFRSPESFSWQGAGPKKLVPEKDRNSVLDEKPDSEQDERSEDEEVKFGISRERYEGDEDLY